MLELCLKGETGGDSNVVFLVIYVCLEWHIVDGLIHKN